MKTLEDNKEGYINSAVRNVTGFNNVDFLLIHGTEDGILFKKKFFFNDI